MIVASYVVLWAATALFAFRLLRGPSLADRVIGIDGMIVTGISLIIVKAMDTGVGAFLPVAVVLALVSFISTSVIARFIEADPGNAQFFVPAANTGHALFDLPGYIAARIRRTGIVQFEDLGLCNYADPERFFSFRRATHLGEKQYGRQISAIMLT